MKLLLGIGIALVFGGCCSRFKRWPYETGMGILGFIMLISEFWKQWTLTFLVNGGHYNVWYFPFQLCSLPMYLCPLLLIVPACWKRRIQVFLMDFTLLGALAVFLDTTGMQYPLHVLTIHSYLWHFLLIVLGSWSGFDWIRTIDGRFRDTFRQFGESIFIWLPSLLIATVFNILLWRFGEISMFYVSPFEPSTQIIIHNIAVKYGIHVGNLVYLAVMLVGAVGIHVVWCFWGKIKKY